MITLNVCDNFKNHNFRNWQFKILISIPTFEIHPNFYIFITNNIQIRKHFTNFLAASVNSNRLNASCRFSSYSHFLGICEHWHFRNVKFSKIELPFLLFFSLTLSVSLLLGVAVVMYSLTRDYSSLIFHRKNRNVWRRRWRWQERDWVKNLFEIILMLMLLHKSIYIPRYWCSCCWLCIYYLLCIIRCNF